MKDHEKQIYDLEASRMASPRSQDRSSAPKIRR